MYSILDHSPPTGWHICIGTAKRGHLEAKMWSDKKLFFSSNFEKIYISHSIKNSFFVSPTLDLHIASNIQKVKVICHTSIKSALVNESNFYHSMNLKFQKSLNFLKTSLSQSKIFSEHLEMIISQNTFDFKWHRIAFIKRYLP